MHQACDAWWRVISCALQRYAAICVLQKANGQDRAARGPFVTEALLGREFNTNVTLGPRE